METSVSFLFAAAPRAYIEVKVEMLREYAVNVAVVVGLAIIVSLSWVGSPANAGWSRFIGSVVFYAGIEMMLWFITHPLIQERRLLSFQRSRGRKNLPPE
ncbi:MAG: hypothetical protein HY782_26435 [Chloroflexi bacterium]|nr:hypothetical protein [Chloroflexota bacterium]